MDLGPATRLLENGIAFVQRSGLKVVELRRGHVKCRMPFQNNGNHIGTMYAGALFTLAEIPGGALFLSSFDTARFYPIVKSLDLRFLKPVKTDATITVTLEDAQIEALQAEASERGKAEFVLDAEILDSSGQAVAASHGVYQLRRVG